MYEDSSRGSMNVDRRVGELSAVTTGGEEEMGCRQM